MLSISGTAHADGLNGDGSIGTVSIKTDVTNVSSEKVGVAHALTLFCGAGGFACGIIQRKPDQNGNPGSLFNIVEPMAKGFSLRRFYEGWNFGGAPYDRVVHVVRALAVRPLTAVVQHEHKLIKQVPVAIDNLTTFSCSQHPAFPVQSPGPLSLDWPVSVGLMGPLQSFPVADLDQAGRLRARSWLTVVGQIINLDSGALQPAGAQVTLGDRGTYWFNKSPAAIDAPPSSGADVARRFFFSQPVPDVQAGNQHLRYTNAPLTIDVQYNYAGAAGSVSHTDMVSEIMLPTIRTPLDVPASLASGTLHFGNGVGDTGWNLHNGSYTQRYAYDFNLRDSSGNYAVNGNGSTNANCYIWSQPLLAVADGTVVFAGDPSPDHQPGADAGTDLPNVIVLAHAGGLYSLYAHVQHLSMRVRVGDAVAAGQVIGLVGDNNGSSGPHLHFTCYRYDASGAMQSVPVQFSNLRAAGQQVFGAPRASFEGQTA